MGSTTFTSNNGRCIRVFSVINTFFIILALAAFIAMALILNKYNKNLEEHMDSENPPTQDTSSCDQHVDIAIVGAGAAGVFAAWRLSERYPDKSIQLYESNSRIGGKLYTIPIPGIEDFVADLGAMRFYKEWHPLLFQAINELGLEVVNFTTPKESEKIYHLRGEYLLRQQLDAGDVPYGLPEQERNISGRQDKLIALWNSQFIQPNEDDPYEKKTFDGKFVYNLGNYNEWQKYGSNEGLKYLADTSGYDDWVFANQNLAKLSETDYVENPEPWPSYLTLKGGMGVLPKTMVEKFLQANTRGNRVLFNHELLSINSATPNLSMVFQDTETMQKATVCTDKLILAIGATALEQVDWPDISQNVEIKQKMETTTLDIPAVKVFLAYDSPWWRSSGQGWAFDQIRESGASLKMLVTDLPLRMVLDIGEDSKTGKSLLLVYNTDELNLNFWKHHMEQGERDSTALDCEFTPSVELVNLTQTYLAKVFNISITDIPAPYASVAHAWYDKPYYNAWHLWSPGNKFHEVQDAVLKPLPDREVFVIGEAYSDSMLHGWIEGAYERAEAMLQTYFNDNRGTMAKVKRKKRMFSPVPKPPAFYFLNMRQ